MKIEHFGVREVLDSRGDSTIEVSLFANGREARTAVPRGKSCGGGEAKVLTITEAAASIARVRTVLRENNFQTMRAFDEALLDYDATPTKETIGGDVALGLSLSFAKVHAAEHGKELWKAIREEFFPHDFGYPYPYIFSNVINGGAHAKNHLSIQEYMLVAKPTAPFFDGVRTLIKLYRTLGVLLARGRKEDVPIGDEGGYSVAFKDDFAPIALLDKLIAREGLSSRFCIALDVAASGFADGKGRYKFGKSLRNSDGMTNIYRDYVKKAKLLWSFEDPFDENDEDGFLSFAQTFPTHLTVGDDLTVTDPVKIETLGARHAITGVIIKPNQVGTLTESCEAILAARRNGVRAIVSHRSGETDDVSIIHLAKACGVFGVKIGAPVRERVLKFNELLRLYA